MRERQGDSHENDGYIDSRRSPKLFGVRSDLRNDGRSLLEFRTPSQTIQQDVYRSRTAEEDGAFTSPEADEETGQFHDDLFNDVLKKILDADKKEA